MELECTKGLEELVSEVIVHAVNNENTTKKKGNAEAVIIEENIVENPDSNIVIETFSAEESESMDIEGVESNEIETITRTDEPLVSESTATNEQNAIADSPELSNCNNETPEQPAAITTAITTIISHFVSIVLESAYRQFSIAIGFGVYFHKSFNYLKKGREAEL